MARSRQRRILNTTAAPLDYVVGVGGVFGGIGGFTRVFNHSTAGHMRWALNDNSGLSGVVTKLNSLPLFSEPRNVILVIICFSNDKDDTYKVRTERTADCRRI